MLRFGESFTPLKRISLWIRTCQICQSKVKILAGENTLNGRPGESDSFERLYSRICSISPRTSFIDASINGISEKYIIQEKPAKEMLEYHRRRESAILGINTQILYSLRSQGNRLNDPYMSMIFPKLLNHNWAKKNNSSSMISFNAVKKFSNVFQGSWSDDWDGHITFSDSLLSGGDRKSFLK